LRRRWLELHDKVHELGVAQVRVLQSEKMAAIGELAAGVAHHLNTPIGFVKSNLGCLERYQNDLKDLAEAYRNLEGECPPDSAALARVRALRRNIDYDFLCTDCDALIEESRTGLNRIGQIVHDLRAFARAGEAPWQQADLHECLEATLRLLDQLHSSHPEISRDFCALPPIWCIPAQLNQAFLSLLDNAVEATPMDGSITLRTRRQGDDRVVVECIDTGIGIEPDRIGHLVEPFYSKRRDGQGTGMGLPLVYGISHEHGGDLEIESTPGKGSTFRMILPIAGPEGRVSASG
jgi:signal transduction histidine kinase